MTKPQATGFTRIIHAVSYSRQGWLACWRSEAAFRQEVLACGVLFPAAVYFGNNGVEIALLIGSCLLVVVVEIINSAIEAVVDRVGGEHHILSGQAKDMGSAAVMLSILNVAIIWGFVLLY